MRWILILFVVFQCSSCWLIRAYRLRHMNLTDYKKLPSVKIERGITVFQFIDGTEQPQYNFLKRYLDSSLSTTHTAAFLVIRNDSIIYENYFDGFTKDDILPSNSMTKSFTGTLVRIANNEGKIKSLDEPITNYIPELQKRDSNFKKITIQHLLDMRSGLDFNEGRYDLHDDAIRYGLRRNMKKYLLKIKIAEPPGRFRYQSVNTQFLGLITERATGKKLSSYLEEKLWQPLGTEHDATWNVDSKKQKREFASAGLNATARDFAKLGQLYLNQGKWYGQQIIDENWIHTIANADTMNKYNGYKNQWWSRTNNRNGAFSAIGFLNQYLYVNPNNNVVIVRIGKRWANSYGVSTRFIYSLGESL
ncbi:MAG TPA: serine hydrolase [Flavisolibacter sp.]|nr:serine hydrolase [Flavisolibacter sp.]